MKARIVLPISAGFALLAAVFAWQIGPTLRGSDRPVPQGTQAVEPMTGPAAVKIAFRQPEGDLINGGAGKESWTAFAEFTFDFDEARMQAPDKDKVTKAAAYVAANPSAQIGLDGRSDPNGNGLRNQTLTDRRVAAVRDALIKAGIPSEKIQIGNFAGPQARRDREVAAVIITAPKNP